MKAIFPKPPAQYAQFDEIQFRQLVEQALLTVLSSGVDNYVGVGRIILTAPDGGLWALQVDNAGALSAVAA